MPARAAPDRLRILAVALLALALLAALAAIAYATRAPTAEMAPAPPVDLARAIRVAAPAPAPEPARPAVQAPEPLLEIKRVLPVASIAFGEWKWDETGAPADGRIVMTIDLKAQTISVFRGGWEIGTAAVLYGADEKPTPLGKFPVLEKDADHVSNLYGAPMPFMLRLTNDGVAIHGSRIEEGYATHDCIGVPTAFARKLFGAVKRGDVAVITQGKLMKLGDRVA